MTPTSDPKALDRVVRGISGSRRDSRAAHPPCGRDRETVGVRFARECALLVLLDVEQVGRRQLLVGLPNLWQRRGGTTA